MSLIDRHRRLARGEAEGPGDHAASAFLAALSVAYRGAVALRNAGYAHGLLPIRRAPVPVLVVGSLSAGGTGKTPCAAYLARRLSETGHRPLLVAGGYGAISPAPVPTLVTTGTGKARADWQCVGEEAILLARLAPGVPVAVARKREEALACYQRHGGAATLLILDGGFQHRRLHADVKLVTCDASRPAGTGHLLPWGDMREPWRALRRADAIILHRWELCSDPAAWEGLLDRTAPATLRAWTRNLPAEVRSLQGEPLSWERLRSRRLGLWTAIANPAALLAALGQQGVHPVSPRLERDHAPFGAARAESLRALARAEKLDAFLVTAKDAVKLEAWAGALPPVLVLSTRFEFVTGREALDALLRDRLGRGARA
jgi:tetraacyldisaccharide 4'-kinase